MMNLILFFVVVFVFISIIILVQWFNKKLLLKKIDAQWGTFQKSYYDLETSKLYTHFNKQRDLSNAYTLDDETWKDLNLDEQFELMNRAVTPLGSQLLYDMLKHPRMSKNELDKREEIINIVTNNDNLRRNIQFSLLGLAKVPAKYLAYSLWQPIPQKPKYSFVFYLLSALSLWVAILSVLGLIHWGFAVIVYIINLSVYRIYEKKLNEFVVSFQFLSELISKAYKISSLLPTELKQIKSELEKELINTKKISKKIYSLQLDESNNPIVLIYNSYTLAPITGFISVINSLGKNISSLQRIFELMGYLDALIAVASYRKQFPKFCNPVFNDNAELSVKNITHPLVIDPVPNDFTFDKKCLLITGSNMSGKSTFLKTLGVNAILAQTFNICFAENYSAPFLQVLSSIERNDDIINGKSYYMTEVESILRIINSSKTKNICLFLIDEIFRGTNSVERTAASVEVLRFLNNQKDFIIVATHDLQLTEFLNESYHNFHFRETMTDSGLSFDYKLHAGKSGSKNAIALLKYVGYPESIVEGANQHIRAEKQP